MQAEVSMQGDQRHRLGYRHVDRLSFAETELVVIGNLHGVTPAHSLRQPLQSFSSTNCAFLTPDTVNLPTDPSMFRISA